MACNIQPFHGDFYVSAVPKRLLCHSNLSLFAILYYHCCLSQKNKNNFSKGAQGCVNSMVWFSPSSTRCAAPVCKSNRWLPFSQPSRTTTSSMSGCLAAYCVCTRLMCKQSQLWLNMSGARIWLQAQKHVILWLRGNYISLHVTH